MACTKIPCFRTVTLVQKFLKLLVGAQIPFRKSMRLFFGFTITHFATVV
jgi:hypothetical protein